MNLQLKSFSQDVDLAEPDKILYYLVFQTESGNAIRLPVQKETTEELIRLVYKKKIAAAEEPSPEPEAVPEEPREETDEEYDDDMAFDENGDPIEAASVFQDEAPYEEQETPESEEEVPSL